MSGRLFYIVGASGSGKDTLIQYARNALAEESLVFAHRYITRDADAQGENHVALSPREFALRQRKGLFALAWESHGYQYGIGVEIDTWLAHGLDVVVNGSRSYLPSARERYPDMQIVWVRARPEVLAARLEHRGRESGRQVDARLARNAQLDGPTPPDAVEISNDGPLERAGNRLVALLSRKPRLL